jgi:hypothetical protein
VQLDVAVAVQMQEGLEEVVLFLHVSISGCRVSSVKGNDRPSSETIKGYRALASKDGGS